MSFMYSDIDAMLERVNKLFPEKDRGYGDDMRNLLRIADNCNVQITMSQVYAVSILSILDELVGRMEKDDAEQRAEDAHWSEQERAAAAAAAAAE